MKKMKIRYKLCRLDKKEIEENIDALAELVSRPKYICLKCGRVCRKKGNLCKPMKLPSRLLRKLS
jgi:hypothetical protein